MWVHDPDWPSESIQGPVSETWVDTHGLCDPGIGGPCLFRDIMWIRFPVRIQNRTNGNLILCQAIEPFAADLANLGLLPITRTDDFIQICGYRTASLPGS